MQNIRKWIQGAYIFSAAIVWVFFFHLSDLVLDLIGWNIPLDWFLTIPQIIGFVTAIIAFIVLQRNEVINKYSQEVASELAKVTWPEKKETVMSTGVIAVMVAISAVILFVWDSAWGSILRMVY